MTGSINDLQHKALGLQADKQNSEKTTFISAVRTADSESADVVNTGARGLHLIIDMTSVPGTDTVTFTVQGKDTLSGKYYDLLVSLAIVATGTTILKIYPGISPSPNASASDVLPDIFRVKAEHSSSTDFTYTVSAKLVV